MNRREILFRGKRVDNGEWVEGNLTINEAAKAHRIVVGFGLTGDMEGECHVCFGEFHLVDPSTIGQYVGKIGANSCEVWEGDKVIARLNHHGKPTTLEIPAFIDYNERVGAWQIRYENHLGELVNDNIGFRYFLEVVGTIHDTQLTQQS